MNVRELLARLNVPAVRYDIGRGGIPELTNIDIAAALGMVKETFGRDIMCAVWWPDGNALTSDRLSGTIRVMLLTEYSRRERNAVAMRLEAHMAKCELELRDKPTKYDIEAYNACKVADQNARAQRWPWNTDVYAQIYPMMLDDLRDPHLCKDCAGRKKITFDSLVIQCETCHGTGIRHRSIGWRAERLGIKETTYRRDWEKVYSWLYRQVIDAETRAAYQLRDAVMGEAEAA